MTGKTQQLQIRVTPQQKAAIKRMAQAAGVDVSRYILSRLLPPGEDRFAEIIRAIPSAADYRYVLAELNDFLHACPPIAFPDAVAGAAASVGELTPYLQNYVAAMVEQAASDKQVQAPPWVRDIPPLSVPTFATALQGLRLHVLRSSPVAFKRRNIFVDASLGARV